MVTGKQAETGLEGEHFSKVPKPLFPVQGLHYISLIVALFQHIPTPVLGQGVGPFLRRVGAVQCSLHLESGEWSPQRSYLLIAAGFIRESCDI